MSSGNLILIGGPESGKSNYLFRAWIEIEANRGRLIKNGLPDDIEYLHDNATILLGGNFAPHTPFGTTKISEIPVADSREPKSSRKLIVPDASGELWLKLYERREWPASWYDLIDENSGFLLLVRAGSPHNVPPLDWLTCERLYCGQVKPTPSSTPTQVLLVDWLQILRFIVDGKVGSHHRPRLSVVVSAWDAIPSSRKERPPLDYLEIEFPLFSEFLRAGHHGFDLKVFGLSIVGGDLTSDKEFHQTFINGDPTAFGYVVDERGTEIGDVLLPMCWALGID